MDEIEAIKKEISLVAAENMALQSVLICLFQRLGAANPAFRIPILQAFDDAASFAENQSLRLGRQAGHMPETLRIIESLRTILIGKDKPANMV